MFILDRIDRELPSLERLELKFGLSSEFFDKIPVRILLDVLFRVFRFSKASFYALTSSFITFYETYGRLPWQFCNFTCEITNYPSNFVPKLRSNSSHMILHKLHAFMEKILGQKCVYSLRVKRFRLLEIIGARVI